MSITIICLYSNSGRFPVTLCGVSANHGEKFHQGLRATECGIIHCLQNSDKQLTTQDAESENNLFLRVRFCNKNFI